MGSFGFDLASLIANDVLVLLKFYFRCINHAMAIAMVSICRKSDQYSTRYDQKGVSPLE
jgi:hypothetical protein